MSATTTKRRELAAAETQRAVSEGLLNAGKEHAFFKALELGEARSTSLLQRRKKKNKENAATAVLRTQWWAPAKYVRLNKYLMKHGVSSKLRTKAFLCLLAGKDLPAQLNELLASYTESLLLRS
jgi:hypothetical protein